MARITKSFTLDSEPVLHWPVSLAELARVEGVRQTYSGKGMEYDLHIEQGSSVELVGWPPKQVFAGWRNLFAEPQLRPIGLMKLAELNPRADAQTICEWVSLNGLLGFSPISNPVVPRGNVIPRYAGDTLIHHYEPIDCIRTASQRAANVLKLWAALKGSYTTGQGRGSEKAIQSIVTINENLKDSYQRGAEIGYRVFVNGEPRSRRPFPKSPRGWRKLANVLLAEYIQEHIEDEVRVSIGIQEQNKDEEERHTEPAPDWNLKPLWRIQSALAAYYVELLMVMRRFRSCKICGRDISHQKAKSVYCGSTCRSKKWHRDKSAEKKATKPLHPRTPLPS